MSHQGNNASSKVMNKFGRNPDINAAAAEDVWDQGGTYTFDTTGINVSISSSQSGDNQSYTISGLAPTTWAELSETITAAGLTSQTLTNKFIRINRVKNNGSSNNAGDIYIYKTGSPITSGVPNSANQIRAKILAGNNQTLMAIYTIPGGKTGKLRSWWASLAKRKGTTGTMLMILKRRPNGGVFQVKELLAIQANGMGYFNRVYDKNVLPLITEKTDIKIIGDTSTANIAVSAGFDIELI